MKKILISLFMICLSLQLAAETNAKIVAMDGDVKIRRGIEETWQPAGLQVLLKEIDTITTGEDGEVTLAIYDGLEFRLGPNAILDIADLKKVSEQEMFLFLTRQKVDRLKKREGKRKLRTTNISAPHGEDKSAKMNEERPVVQTPWESEKNGATALFSQAYYTNAVVKLHKIATRYPRIEKCSEFHFLLGRSFELLEQNGQAIDAYRAAASAAGDKDCDNPKWVEEARKGLDRLKN